MTDNKTEFGNEIFILNDTQEKIFDYKTGVVVKDTVKVLKTNSIMSTGNSIGYPISWAVVDTVTEADGYQDNRKVKVGFFDSDDDGVIDNPDLFDIIVEPTTAENTKFIFFDHLVRFSISKTSFQSSIQTN